MQLKVDLDERHVAKLKRLESWTGLDAAEIAKQGIDLMHRDRVMRRFMKILMGRIVVGGLAFVGAITLMAWWMAPEPRPLMLTPQVVDGPWPFREQAVRVSCCTLGSRISIIDGNGRSYYFGDNVFPRNPVSRIGILARTLRPRMRPRSFWRGQDGLNNA